MRIRFMGQVITFRAPAVQWVIKVLCVVIFLFAVTTYLGRTPDLDRKRRRTDGELFRPLDVATDHKAPMGASATGAAGTGSGNAMSAMEAGKVNARLLRQVQRDILRNQNRPPDDTYNINVTLSDDTPLDRAIPDTRPEVCRTFSYDVDQLPAATVVIPFYNEALSMLLRTVHSILARTPDRLLGKVILVDDASTRGYLKEPLDRYLRLLPKVQLIRNARRQGLIRARMRGYRLAATAVVVFQDAHTECNVGWLQPILADLMTHPRSVVQPFVDGVDRLTLEFAAPPTYYRGAFSWDLRYTWLRLPEHEQIRSTETGQPFFTPTLVGCALAVRKDYFDEIGWFDEGLNVWGGENIELGFRTWMCGGRVVTVTCSRVGHVFKEFPYQFDGNKEEIVQKNLIRVAETWMDGWKKYFYATTRVYDFKRHELNEAETRSLAARVEQRKKMNCKSFEWFVYNVIPEMEIPPMDAKYYGEVTNSKSQACWEVQDDFKVGMTYFCFFHKIIPKNNFALTVDGLLKYREKCVRIAPPDPMLTVGECPRSEGEKERLGVWQLENRGQVWGRMRVKRRRDDGVWEQFCVTQVTNVLAPHKGEQMPQIGGDCDDANDFQTWSWTYGLDWSQVPESALTKYRN